MGIKYAWFDEFVPDPTPEQLRIIREYLARHGGNIVLPFSLYTIRDEVKRQYPREKPEPHSATWLLPLTVTSRLFNG